MKIALLVTCLGDVLRPSAGQAAVRLLRRLGHEVEFRRDQTCCGQPLFNSGFSDLARQQARHTIRVFESAECVVAPSGSCAAMVKIEYPHLLADEPDWSRRAVELSEKTFELSQFLVRRLGLLDVGARYAGKVACHYACHLRMLGATDEVEQLVRRVAGAELVPLERQDHCCGFGGSFAVRYPQISGSMVDNKLASVVASGADTLVSTDAGCLMNIGGRMQRTGSKVRILHLAELLDSR